jgi:uncharacterized phage protein gp47/JayE
MPTSIAPTIDATGVHVPSYTDIRQWLVDQYKLIFGADVYLDADGQDGQFLSILALALNDWTADIVSTYNAMSPTTAQGTGLSSVVKINGLSRAIPTQSTVDVDIVGVSGTAINTGIVQDANGVKWDLPALVTIPPAGTITVTATAQDAGSISAPIGTVTNIITPTNGWQSVTNASVATPGSPVESDAALRRRQAVASGLPSVSALGAVQSALGQLVGVTEVAPIHENYTDATDADGVPEHSIAVVIVGGDVDDIASTIALKKSPGCNTFGTTSVLTTDPNGLPITINFSRPVDVPVDIVIDVIALAGYSGDVAAEQIASVTAYVNGLNIGAALVFNRIWPSALLNGSASAGTFQIDAMTVNGGTADVPVDYNENIVVNSVTVNQV